VDSLTVVREPERARVLVRSATDEELAAAEAIEVLGDAALRASAWQEALSLTERGRDSPAVQRIRASSQLEAGGLYEQNSALAVLDELVAGRGREAAQAAFYRLAATLGRRHAGWSEDAFDALHDDGFEAAAVSA